MMKQKNVVLLHAINVNHYVFINYIQCMYSVSFNSIASLRTHRKDHRVKIESKVTPITVFLIINVMSLSNIVWLKCFRFFG